MFILMSKINLNLKNKVETSHKTMPSNKSYDRSHTHARTCMHTHVWKDRGDKGIAGVTGGALKRPEGLVCGRGRRGASRRQVAC